MSSYKITVSPSEVVMPKIIKFPETRVPIKSTNNKVVVLSPSENPSTQQFAFDLLQSELQLECNQNVNQKLITKLFELYRLGIQYYNQRRSKKQFYFKKKLQALTNNPVVLGVLHECDTKADTFYKKKQIEKMVEIDERKIMNANEILKSVFKSELKVQSQLKNQSDLLQKRIEQRRLLKKSFQGESTNGSFIEETPTSNRKKLTKTVIVCSSNPQDDQSAYFVDGAIISHEI